MTSVKDGLEQDFWWTKIDRWRVINHPADTGRALAGGAGTDGNQASQTHMPKGLQAQSRQVLWWVGGRNGSKSKMMNGGQTWLK